MTEVAVIVMEGVFDSALALVVDTLRTGANEARRLGLPHFSVRTVAIRGHAPTTAGGQRFAVDGGLTAARDAPFVVIPGVGLSHADELGGFLQRPETVAIARSLTQAGDHRSVVAAACTATFLLAESGLLDDRTATTTWWLAGQFRSRYPSVRLHEEMMVTQDGPTICAGAAMAHMDLALALLGRLGGQTLSNEVASMLLLDQRASQSRYMVTGHLARSSDQIVHAEQWIRQHLHEPITIADIAREVGVSARTLARRFVSATGRSPLRFLQRLRVEQAIHLLETTTLPFDRITDRCGYMEPAALRRVIRRDTGSTPSAIRAEARRRQAVFEVD